MIYISEIREVLAQSPSRKAWGKLSYLLRTKELSEEEVTYIKDHLREWEGQFWHVFDKVFYTKYFDLSFALVKQPLQKGDLLQCEKGWVSKMEDIENETYVGFATQDAEEGDLMPIMGYSHTTIHFLNTNFKAYHKDLHLDDYDRRNASENILRLDSPDSLAQGYKSWYDTIGYIKETEEGPYGIGQIVTLF